MTRLIKRFLLALGLELRRARDPSLPLLREVAFDGGRFSFWIVNSHTKAWWDKPSLHLNAEFRSLQAMCRPGSVVFDVGAHHGIDTVLFSLWTGPSGHVYAFEANAENALTLRANIGANRLTNCDAVHTAVGARSGSIHLSNEVVAPGDPLARVVPLTSLDEFCARAAIGRVDVLKIDVEGFEGEVLRGAQQVLAQRPRIALELHLDVLPRFRTSATQVLAQLDLPSYDVTAMVRPDWETLSTFHRIEDLPRAGVVNLFLTPKHPR